MRAIVTGGACLVGSHLVDRLPRDGAEVIVENFGSLCPRPDEPADLADALRHPGVASSSSTSATPSASILAG
jgi:nucleoside-diphosphate-sugar epimerase